MSPQQSLQVSDPDRIVETSRRNFLLGASAAAIALTGTSPLVAEGSVSQQDGQAHAAVVKQEDADHFYASREQPELWKSQSFSIDRWWGDFSRSSRRDEHVRF